MEPKCSWQNDPSSCAYFARERRISTSGLVQRPSTRVAKPLGATKQGKDIVWWYPRSPCCTHFNPITRTMRASILTVRAPLVNSCCNWLPCLPRSPPWLPNDWRRFPRWCRSQYLFSYPSRLFTRDVDCLVPRVLGSLGYAHVGWIERTLAW